jgi:acyl-CoA synthetase
LSAGSGAPIFLQTLLAHQDCTPAHHRLIDFAALGGATVPAGLIKRAEAVGVIAAKTYGCTEHPSISLGRRTDTVDARANTDGRICAGVEVRVRDAAGVLQSNGTGEILTRGPDLFSGYLDSALNESAFDRGWYSTGDLGTVSDDGHLTVTDRIKDIVIRAGLNVSASEVEAALSSMPEIADVAMVAAPDPRTGEHGCAFIRTVEGAPTPTLARIREHLAAVGLAKFKWPEEVRAQLDDFPRSPAGKVLKTALRDQARLRPE